MPAVAQDDVRRRGDVGGVDDREGDVGEGRRDRAPGADGLRPGEGVELPPSRTSSASAPSSEGRRLSASPRSARWWVTPSGSSKPGVFRETAVTCSPAPASSETSGRPMFPVAPVTAIMVSPRWCGCRGDRGLVIEHAAREHAAVTTRHSLLVTDCDVRHANSRGIVGT
ncbi:predicted protein [Streptomyces viridosporus ATCC 14672]|uniref:Predicted protein n=1 Tax=Streptomyces viridosporus (strain ATCC 14672 / DSM 40746 / JCM 4963 / KCTC 9882 / NRRL B-12104 / FH 1290) TaxID=566461 RepID=D5ZPT0_STRV1|nr:predicted protein [Streptomyces viridosporus ATCC 14672]